MRIFVYKLFTNLGNHDTDYEDPIERNQAKK